MPFGFDGVFWRLMDLGIGWMVAVSQWVAALPGAIGRLAAFGAGPLAAMSMGIIVLGLLRTPLRWAGAGLVALAALWALTTPQPDILVAGDGQTVGVRAKDGRLRLMRTAKDTFLSREWLAADADARNAADPSLTEGVSCDGSGCVVQAADGAIIALTLKPEAFSDDCTHAAMIVTLRQPPTDCAALVLDQEMLKRRGPLALRKMAEGYAITAIRPRGVDRPWSPALAEDDAAVPVARPGRPAQSVDATPAESDLQPDD
jgi:competence protein ComEC